MKTAERRMFAKSVIGSARFLRMPVSARLLYYDLGMEADDDGCVEAFGVMRKTGASEDDLRVLSSKGFVRVLNEDLVSYIMDWSRNNLIRKDRYHKGVYSKLIDSCDVALAPDNQSAVTCHPDDNQWLTEVRLGKASIGYIERESSGDDSSPLPDADYESIRKLYNEICKHLPQCRMLSQARKKALGARIRSGYTEDTFREIFSRAEQSDFLRGKNDRNWTASFDWLIKDSNAVKVLDGNYENKKTGVPKGATGELGDAELEAIQRVLRGD